MYDTTIAFRTNSEIKAQAQKLFSELGMDLSTALNIFLKKAIRAEAIPFEVGMREEPNAETWAAIDEVYNHPEELEGPFTSKKDLFEALYA